MIAHYHVEPSFWPLSFLKYDLLRAERGLIFFSSRFTNGNVTIIEGQGKDPGTCRQLLIKLTAGLLSTLGL